jgi:hypothetical protein
MRSFAFCERLPEEQLKPINTAKFAFVAGSLSNEFLIEQYLSITYSSGLLNML